MTTPTPRQPRLSARTQALRAASFWLVRCGVVCGLAACGGGGGGGTDPASQPTVNSVSVALVKYTQSVTVTLNGTNLDQGLTVSTPACATLTRSTAAPLASTSTTAFYVCSGAAVGASQVTVQRASDGATLGTADFTVGLPPQVTFTVTDGAGISGSFVVTLAGDASLTPETVKNFLAYVDNLHYDGTVFHRVFPNFVVQGGGYLPLSTGAFPTEKITTRPPIELEVNKGLLNKQWTVAMARTSAPNSATAQFYVNMVDNPHLDPSPTSAGYSVFGHISSGSAVVTAIANATCSPNQISECAPAPNVLITSAIRTP
jgi:cyclophilin family peptidyl-prolyl cis-trans isomerase